MFKILNIENFKFWKFWILKIMRAPLNSGYAATGVLKILTILILIWMDLILNV